MVANLLRRIGQAYGRLFSNAAKMALDIPTQFGAEYNRVAKESKLGRWIQWTFAEPQTFARWCSQLLLVALVFIEIAIVLFLFYLLRDVPAWLVNLWYSTPEDPPIRHIIAVVTVCHIGAFLYWLKIRKLLLYSVLEIGLSLVIAWKGIAEIKPGELASWAAIISSIYFLVRGVDNAATALKVES